MKLSYIGTLLGIGTFTKNLIHSMVRNVDPRGNHRFVVALSDYEQVYHYPEEVKLIVQQEQQADYLEAANFINLCGADLGVLEQEFGILVKMEFTFPPCFIVSNFSTNEHFTPTGVKFLRS